MAEMNQSAHSLLFQIHGQSKSEIDFQLSLRFCGKSKTPKFAQVSEFYLSRKFYTFCIEYASEMQRTSTSLGSGYARQIIPANPRLPVWHRRSISLQICASTNGSAGSRKGKDGDVVKQLKVVPEILKDEKGVGVLTIAALATAAKLVEIVS